MIKKSTARATMLGISAVTALTVLSGAVSWDTTLAMSVSKAQQTKPSVDLKKMKDLYEQVKTGKRLEAAQEFVAELLKVKTTDVNNVLKSLPLKLKERKWGRSTMRDYTSTDGKGLVFANTFGNQFNFRFKLEEKLTKPDLKVEFPPRYYVLLEKGLPQSFKTEEEANKFIEKYSKYKVKKVVHITSWEQGKEEFPEEFNEKRRGGWGSPLSEEQKNLFKGWLDALKKYGFMDDPEEGILVWCDHKGKPERLTISNKKFYPNHTVDFSISDESLMLLTVPKIDPNPVL